MRRIVLLATLTVGAFAAAPGVASADVDSGPSFGFVPTGFEMVEGKYATLSSNNQIAANGPKVGFFAQYQCTSGQTVGFLAHASQGPMGGPPEGGGSAGASCNGGIQYVFVVAQRSQMPPFGSMSDLTVKGIGFTADANKQLTDLEFAQECLSPLSSSESFCDAPPTAS